MKADETAFQQMVEGTKQFQVPLYQRTYSWQRDELQRLWSDLQEQIEILSDAADGSTQHTSPEHFIGSVVLAPGPASNSKLPCWLLVDGQQRLTSLMIALAAVRDAVAALEEEPEESERIHETYLVNKYKKKLDRYRLLPTQADRAAFTAVIDRERSAGGSDNIGQSYTFFRQRMVDFDLSDLLRVEEVVSSRLTLVEITTDQGDNVFRIFESLNNTGKGLSQTDLLRNYVFMLLPNLGEEVYEGVWLPMQEELGPENLELLGWLDLVLRGDDRAKQSDVYRDQQRRLEKVHRNAGPRSEEAIRDELMELRRLGQLLLRVVEPDNESDEELRAVLIRLQEWGNTIYQPLALHLLRLRDAAGATSEEVAQALTYVESFLVRRMIAGVMSQGLNRTFNAAPTELETDRPAAEAVHRYFSHERRRWPSDRVLAEAVHERNFYWSGRANQRMYVLQRLEQSYNDPEPIDFTAAKLTIEHIMPKTLTPEWRDVLRRQTSSDETPEELHARLLHTLGNLTLTAQNAQLSNHLFRRKQEILDASALRMNREIARSDEWGREAVENRAERLTKQAIRLWPAPLPGGAELEDERYAWQLLRRTLAALPAGNWTSYGDLARLVGSRSNKVGGYLSSRPGMLNAHRVLTSEGEISSSFQWPDEREETPREVLEKEGVCFQGSNASLEQRLDAQALAGLVGLESGSNEEDISPEERRRRSFRAQLAQHQSELVFDTVQGLFGQWRGNGGDFGYGTANETSCTLQVDLGERPLVFLRFYPRSGNLEVNFQQLGKRSPFDELALRRELLARLNQLPDIDIPETKVNLRPSFPMELLPKVAPDLGGVLDWFLDQARSAL
ncbi:GmrSD restriction endonuclease domain-containing protein [Salinactinospora qingdaonensis]|uniref:DUF262 domain-containing protein n=1 Tax=Salinactinospora qingdaonensis TaxID=702744 RepID=A0ABP7GJF1_9ACTN